MTAEPQDCAAQAEIMAWLQGELDSARASALAAHVASCAPCQAFRRDAGWIVDGLRELPPRHARRRATTGSLGLALLGAAALLLCVRLAWPEPAAPSPPGWHVAHQTDEGTWTEGLPSGLGARTVGLHALATLALNREAQRRPDATHLAAVERAARWLVDGQGPDGLLGQSAEDVDMDHALATRALLEAWATTGSDALARPARRALARLEGDTERRLDRATRAWAGATLRRAAELGLPVSGSGAAPDAADHHALRSLGSAERLGPLVARSLAVLADRISD